MHSSSVKYVVTIFILVVMFVAAVVFGFWAFNSRNDYKDHSDKRVSAAVEVAKVDAAKVQQAKDAEVAKQPYKTYTGSLTYGGITFNYPRTWSALVDSTDDSEPINAYFYPDILPGLNSKSAFSLRVELLAQDYPTTVGNFENDVTSGDIKATAYIPPKMAGVSTVSPGLKLEGKITPDFQGTMVVIKVRDKTLEVSTQSKDFLSDFNNVVLASLAFVP